MSEPYDDENEYEDDRDEGDGGFGFSEEDCGRWRNGRLVAQCTLAGSEDCDWECPIGIGGRLTP